MKIKKQLNCEGGWFQHWTAPFSLNDTELAFYIDSFIFYYVF